jgi:hypothetical protein
VSIPLTMLKETKRRYIRPQSLLKALQECFNQDESIFSWSINFREAPPEKLPHDKLRDMELKLVCVDVTALGLLLTLCPGSA